MNIVKPGDGKQKPPVVARKFPQGRAKVGGPVTSGKRKTVIGRRR